jgi:hypothetical protein
MGSAHPGHSVLLCGLQATEGRVMADPREQIEDEGHELLRIDDKAIGNAGMAYMIASLPQQPLASNQVSLPAIKAAVLSYLKEVGLIEAAPLYALVDEQAEDKWLWSTDLNNSPTVAILQDKLRDLHALIEEGRSIEIKTTIGTGYTAHVVIAWRGSSYAYMLLAPQLIEHTVEGMAARVVCEDLAASLEAQT